MTFPVLLMCWYYRDTLLLTRLKPNHLATVSWHTSFTGSNDYLCIHPRAIDLSIKARMCDPCRSFWIVV